MTQTTTKARRYDRQRPTVTPPHVALGDLRSAVGITIDELIARVEEETGRRYTRGAISAVENGHRGASEELLEGLALAYGLRRDALTTTYEPRKLDQVPA